MKSKQQDSLFGSQNSAIVTKPTRRVPLKSHFFHSTRLGACTHSLIWPKQKPGWEKYMVLEVCIDQLVDLKTANWLPGHSAFLEVCTDFLRSFYTRLPKMRCVPVHRDTSQKFGNGSFADFLAAISVNFIESGARQNRGPILTILPIRPDRARSIGIGPNQSGWAQPDAPDQTQLGVNFGDAPGSPGKLAKWVRLSVVRKKARQPSRFWKTS
jgi:hypothetical protein